MKGWTDVRTDVDDVMAIKPHFRTSMGYHIFLTMVLRYNYRPGVALAQDRKFVIISDGGDRITGYITPSVTQFARELRVSMTQ